MSPLYFCIIVILLTLGTAGGRSYRTVSWTDETRRSPPPSWVIYPDVQNHFEKHSLCAVREKKNMSILLIIIILFVMFIMYNVKFPLLFYGDQFSFRERSSVNKEFILCLRLWALARGTPWNKSGSPYPPHCTCTQSTTHTSKQIKSYAVLTCVL